MQAMAATGTMTVGRDRALALRARRQQLAEPAGRVDVAAALGLGLQDTPRGSALLALRARVATAPERVGRVLDRGRAGGRSLVLAMTLRGAPHVVARRDLPLLTAALRPDDAREAADGDLVADAMRDVLGARPSVTRPDLSAGLNARLPDRLRSWCQRCEARHVPEGLFRRATLWAGFVIDPEGSPTRFVRAGDGDDSGGGARGGADGADRADGAAPLPDAAGARAELVRRFVRLVGPTRPDQVARWLDVDGTRARAWWALVADDLVRVDVDGQRSWALAADEGELTGNGSGPAGATGAGTVRLLPPGDPWLLGDRNRLVTEREHRGAVWRPLGSPGVVLDGHDVVGTWRHRMDGGALAVTVTPFPGAGLRRAARAALDGEAAAVAALRGAGDVSLTVEDG
jgi:hypothetical protein